MKAANACGNNEGAIPGGNKRRNIARLQAFLRRSLLNCAQIGEKGLSIDVNAARSGESYRLNGREGVGLKRQRVL